MSTNWAKHLKRIVLALAVALALVFSGAPKTYADPICDNTSSIDCPVSPSASAQPGIGR